VGGAGGIAPSMGAGGQAGGPGTMSIETCAGVVPTGVGVPAGTVVTASAADATDPATNAINGDVTDEWSTGTVTGWITLTFPTPITIGAVRIHADAKPVGLETFTLTTSTSPVPLGSTVADIALMPDGGTLVPEIPIPAGVYGDLTLSVNAGESWVGVNEIWLLPAPTCP